MRRRIIIAINAIANSSLFMIARIEFAMCRDLVIAYRVLGWPTFTGFPIRERPRGNTPGDDTLNDNSDSTLLVVVPGLFQTLDTIENAILPLLDAHPSLTVLLMAPPGFPNTRWPAAAKLSGKVERRPYRGLR